MKSKKISSLGLTALAALMLPLAACSGTTAQDSSGNGDTDLVWSIWAGSAAETEAWQHLADMVNEQDPSLNVTIQTSAWNDYWTKLPTLLAGGDAPCIAGMQMARVQQFDEFLVPLDDLLDDAGIDPDEFDPGILGALSADGELMAVPYDLGPYIMYYNKDAFAAAGVPEPENGWSIDEFEEAAESLTTDGMYGFAVDNSIDAANVWGPTIGGAQAATEDNMLNVDDPAIQETLEWYASLVDSGVAAPTTSGDVTAISQFLGENAAMSVGGPWDMVNVKAQAKFDVGVVTIPAGDEGPGTVIGGSGFGITQQCENKEAAADAIAILTSPEALGYLGTEGRAFPARPSEQGAWYQSAVEGAQETLDVALETGVPYLSTPTWVQDGLRWSQGVVTVINGESEAADFLASVQSSSGSN